MNRVRAVSMRAPIKIAMQDFQGVLDTGTEVTVINKNFFYQLPEKDRPVIKACRSSISGCRKREETWEPWHGNCHFQYQQKNVQMANEHCQHS